MDEEYSFYYVPCVLNCGISVVVSSSRVEAKARELFWHSLPSGPLTVMPAVTPSPYFVKDLLKVQVPTSTTHSKHLNINNQH